MSKGKLPLNDLAGGAGRMDVLIRAVMSALLTSHGLRPDVEVILHLQGGPGPHRRLKFVGSELRGFHAEERSVAGLIAKAIQQPMPAIGQWTERTPGLYDGGGNCRRHSRSGAILLWFDLTQTQSDCGERAVRFQFLQSQIIHR